MVSTVRVSVTAVCHQKTVNSWMASVGTAVPLTSQVPPVKVTHPVDSHVPLLLTTGYVQRLEILKNLNFIGPNSRP